MDGALDISLDAVLHGNVTAVLNVASGSVGPKASAEMEAIFDAAGMAQARVVSVDPAGLDNALDEAVADCDLLVVLGGDGTIRTAAEKCGQGRSYLMPLPGGTMNMLPKALYGARDWKAALADTLAAPEVHCVSGGRAQGHAFFVAALAGAPTLWADAREALRSWKIGEAARRSITALRRSLSEPLTYAFDEGPQGSAEAVAVMCPLVSRAMDEDERSLEAAAIDAKTAGDALRLGFNSLFDDWRNDPAVSRAKVRRVNVTGHGRVPLILDGERVRLGRSVDIQFTALAFKALIPAISDQPPKM
ncbi:MAG TPA: diacylglycerol kinase family protein [Caulobacteraceae bacterium]|jgi:diacylglycerol kinase family enzyme|nr:diacylglycerol kinase family protein [Caulobacteraceae bacterium]